MKKLVKVLLTIMAITMTSFISVMAADPNTYSTFTFTKSDQKKDSVKALKAKDNDNKAYVTTLEKHPTTEAFKSTIFTRGGTFFARTRLSENRESIYSPLFTFTRNERQVKTYESGKVRFGEEYIIRCETDFNGTCSQVVKWCP